MSERIRPPYRSDDDIPFGGHRWGCFWRGVLYLLGIAVIASGRFMFRFSDWEWLPWLVYLAGFLILLWAFWRRKDATETRSFWWWW